MKIKIDYIEEEGYRDLPNFIIATGTDSYGVRHQAQGKTVAEARDKIRAFFQEKKSIPSEEIDV